MSRPRSLSWVSALIVVVGGVAVAAPALAHTDLDSSAPAADSSVDEPVSEIVLTFTEAVTVADDGFEVLSPQEEVLVPVAETDDDVSFTLPFDPPLAGGAVGVRYEVTSADGHVVDGAFTFTVTAPVPTTTPAPTPTTTAATVATTVPTPTPAPTIPPTDPDDGDVATGAPPSPSSIPDATNSVPVAVTLAEDAGSEDDGSSLPWLWIVLGGVAVAGVAGWLVVRSRASA